MPDARERPPLRLPTHVVAATPADTARAAALAAAWGAVAVDEAAWRAGAGGPVVVWCAAAGLGLRGPAASRAAAVVPRPPSARRGTDPLVRAVGDARTVVDATAGWGSDAGTLAAAGRAVTMVERHPVMAVVLRDALARWRAEGRPFAERVSLHEGDARALRPDVRPGAVLLDPMYPEEAIGRARKAEALHLLRLLVGDDADDPAGLLRWARGVAARRVVVKRPRTAPPLPGPKPAGSLAGRTVRYDLYPTEEAPS